MTVDIKDDSRGRPVQKAKVRFLDNTVSFCLGCGRYQS